MTADRGVAPVPREVRAYRGQPAGVVTRLAAGVVDGAVLGLVLVGGYVAVSAVVFMVDPRGFSFPRVGLVANMTVALGTAVAYFTVAWAISGRSYGDHVMGVRVVTRNERPPGLGMAFVRALACVVFPLGLLWAAVSPANRSLQDVLLRTSVVYDWQPTRVKLATHDEPPG